MGGLRAVADGLGLVFDLDGVVIDSMPMHVAAWQAYLKGIGIEIGAIESGLHGRRNDEIVAEFISGKLSPEEIFEHGAAKEALFREMMKPYLAAHLVPGIVEFLDRCKDVPIGLATNAEPANADFVLDGANLRRFFRVVIDGHQVERPKPYPDLYLRAAGLLGIPPKNCIVFEDSAVGIAAAQASGARVVGVGSHCAELPKTDLFIRKFFNPALGPWLRTVEPDF